MEIKSIRIIPLIFKSVKKIFEEFIWREKMDVLSIVALLILILFICLFFYISYLED